MFYNPDSVFLKQHRLRPNVISNRIKQTKALSSEPSSSHTTQKSDQLNLNNSSRLTNRKLRPLTSNKLFKLSTNLKKGESRLNQVSNWLQRNTKHIALLKKNVETSANNIEQYHKLDPESFPLSRIAEARQEIEQDMSIYTHRGNRLTAYQRWLTQWLKTLR